MSRGGFELLKGTKHFRNQRSQENRIWAWKKRIKLEKNFALLVTKRHEIAWG